jgi:sec-independent protein translocase protein TatA
VVAFIALLIFGNRLPSVMRSLGKSVTEFKKGVAGVEEDIDNAVNRSTPEQGVEYTDAPKSASSPKA